MPTLTSGHVHNFHQWDPRPSFQPAAHKGTRCVTYSTVQG